MNPHKNLSSHENHQDGAENSVGGKAVFILVCLCCVLVTVISVWISALNAIPIGEPNPPHFAQREIAPAEKPVYLLAIHPLHNPQRLFSNFQPLVDIINKNTDEFQIRLIAGRDYGSFEKRLLGGEFDFALANPLQAIASLKKGYRIIGKMGDDANFCGLVIARKDSKIKTPEELTDKTIVYPSPTALAATLMPRLYLKMNGLDFSHVSEIYSGSQESAIMNAYVGNADVACTWPMPWNLLLEERPSLAKELKILWTTDPLINNGLIANENIPDAHKDKIMEILLNLPATAEGREVLKRLSLGSFEKADSRAYERIVRNFLDAYEREFPDSDKNSLPEIVK